VCILEIILLFLCHYLSIVGGGCDRGEMEEMARREE
jgi:hypothetical protein